MHLPDVIIGTTVVRNAAFALEKFLENQKEIQDNYPQSELVIATDEPDFVDELHERLKAYELKGNILIYKTVKPNHAQDRIWSLTWGRNAVREYVLESTNARYLLFIDADMTCDPSVVIIMKQQIENGYDVVHNGYLTRDSGVFTLGLGCSILTREILKKISFKCVEYKNHQIIDEGTFLEMDLVKLHAKLKKGIFLRLDHYMDKETAFSIEPMELSLFFRTTNSPYIRFLLGKLSLLMHRDINAILQKLIRIKLRL